MAQEAFIEITCPVCGAKILQSEDLAHEPIPCPECQTPLTPSPEVPRVGLPDDFAIFQEEVVHLLPDDAPPAETAFTSNPNWQIGVTMLCLALVVEFVWWCEEHRLPRYYDVLASLKDTHQFEENETAAALPKGGREQSSGEDRRFKPNRRLKDEELVRREEEMLREELMDRVEMLRIRADAEQRRKEFAIQRKKLGLDYYLLGLESLRSKFFKEELDDTDVHALGREGAWALVAAAKTCERDERYFVFFLLGHLGPRAREVCPKLAELLKVQDAHLRYHAAEALWQIGADDCVSLSSLAYALADRDSEVRLRATDALVRAGPAAVPYLRKALRHSDSGVRQLVVRILADIPDDVVAQELLRFLVATDDDENVRNVASRALRVDDQQ